MPTEGQTQRAMDAVAEEAPSGKLHLRPGQLALASEAWAHYTSAQRATLQMMRLNAGATPGASNMSVEHGLLIASSHSRHV